MTKADVKKFRDRLVAGMIVKTPMGKGKIITKYPFIARTEKGCWSWSEIYLAEHGVLCADRARMMAKIVDEVKSVNQNIETN
jgi:hypothetical protein